MAGSWQVVRIEDGRAGAIVGRVTAPTYRAAIEKAWNLFGLDTMPVSKGNCDKLSEHDRLRLNTERIDLETKRALGIHR